MNQTEILEKLRLLERMIQVNRVPNETMEGRQADLTFIQDLRYTVSQNKKPWKEELERCNALFERYGRQG